MAPKLFDTFVESWGLDFFASGWACDYLDPWNTLTWYFVTSKVSKAKAEKATHSNFCPVFLGPLLWWRPAIMYEVSTPRWPCWRGHRLVLWLTVPADFPAKSYCRGPPCGWTVMGGQPTRRFLWCSANRLVTATMRNPKWPFPNSWLPERKWLFQATKFWEWLL